jgi:hypothetical protein
MKPKPGPKPAPAKKGVPNGTYFWWKMNDKTKVWGKISFHDDGKHVDLFNSDGMNCKAEEYTLDDKAQVHLTHAGDKDDCATKYMTQSETK